MFRAEIESGLEGIQYLAESCEKKFKGGEITNYVYNENEAFLARETAGLKRLLAYIDGFPAGEKTVAEIALAIEDMVKKRAEEYEDPEAVYQLVHRKIRRIRGYLEELPESR
jgi:hypothetical protein